MIPKKIHYCWFGGKPLDETAIKCINSWKVYFPDYEIIEWNENNFDVTQIHFMHDAYNDQKWAFVADVARLIIVYINGGIYFDTDVEVIKKYDDVLETVTHGFFGLEKSGHIATGLGFASVKENSVIKELIDIYKNLNYQEHKNDLSIVACPILTSKYFNSNNFNCVDGIYKHRGFSFYPSEYFSPIDYQTGILSITPNTHSIHWYTASWQDINEKRNTERSRKLRRIFGKKLGNCIDGVSSCIKTEGFLPYLKSRLLKIIK